MKILQFYKYQGTGNDFIMVDNREQMVVFNNSAKIERLCNRRFGIGADGLILLEESSKMNFRMKYYNADGLEGSMCGNGGRCITAFAAELGIITDVAVFEAVDGVHEAFILDKSKESSFISLRMNDVDRIEIDHDHYVLNTGSPHYVTFVDNPDLIDVYNDGKAIRNNDRFIEKGINVNFVSGSQGKVSIRTYERGVEAETWSCGTGSVAAALALDLEGKTIAGHDVEVHTAGGILQVQFHRTESGFTDIWLKGPAVKVYEGKIDLQKI